MTSTQSEIRAAHNNGPTYADQLADRLRKAAPDFPTIAMGMPYQATIAELHEALDAATERGEVYVHLDPEAISTLARKVVTSPNPDHEVHMFFSAALYISAVQVDEDGDAIIYATTADLAFDGPNTDDEEDAEPQPKERLEELRTELRAETISYGELAELQGLASHIEPGDVELLEAAGVPEFPEESD